MQRGRGRGRNGLDMAVVRQARAAKRLLEASVPATRSEQMHLVLASANYTRVLPMTNHFLVPLAAQILRSMRREGCRVDASDAVADWVLCKRRRVGVTAYAVSVGVSLDFLLRESRRFAAMLWLSDRCQRCLICDALAMGRLRNLLLIEAAECVGYDETPLHLRMPDPADAHGQGRHNTHIVRFGLHRTSHSSKVVTKLFQTQTQWGLLAAWVREGLGTQFLMFFGRTLNEIQCLKDCTASTILVAFESSGAPPHSHNHFESVSRVACKGRHASNHMAEHLLLKRRRNKNAGLVEYNCEIHMTATVTRHCSGVMNFAVRGTLHFALTMCVAGDFHAFWQCVHDTVRERARLYRGDLGLGSMVYRKLAIRTFFALGSCRAARHIALALLPNGRWDNHEEIEFWAGVNDDVDECALFDNAAISITNALLHNKPRIWCQSRWSGAEEAVCDTALLSVCHGVLRPSLELFAYRQSKKRGQSMVGGGANNRLVCDDARYDMARVDAPADARGVGDVVVFQSHEGAVHNFTASASGPNHTEAAAKSLSIALEWSRSSSSGPLGELVIWRMVLGVLQTVTRQQMIIGSAAWERRQSAKAALSPPDVPPGQRRSYRVLEAARGSVEGCALLRISALMFDSRLYYLLRGCDLSNSLRVKAFIALSKAGAGLHKLLSQRHSQYPFRCFLTLDNPAYAYELNKDKPCSRDPWSARFYDRTGFVGDAALARLVLHAMMVFTENARCEVAHANLRRLATRTQTHAITPQDLGVAWAGMQSSSGASVGTDAAPLVTEPETGVARPRGGSGGAWRAFVREQATSDLRRVAALYRRLGDDERSRLREVGRAATEANRAGTSGDTSFGPKRRTILRRNNQRLAFARLQSLDKEVDTNLELERLLDVAVATEHSPQATSRQLSTLARDVRRWERERDRADSAAVARYAEEHTVAAVKDLVAAAPELGVVADAVEAVPVWSGCRAVRVKPSATVKDAYALKAWASDMYSRHNFGAAAERAWEAQHRLISSDELTNP